LTNSPGKRCDHVIHGKRVDGDWDFELREPAAGSTAIGEVEGADGPVDVDKYRQLLDYFQAEGTNRKVWALVRCSIETYRTLAAFWR